MEAAIMRFNHIDINKISVCFTWDDNCHAHCKLTAPLFKQRGLKCTFYINPGIEGFAEYLPGYKALSEAGFETGSHGFYHNHMTELGEAELKDQVKAAADSISRDIGVYPSTFAFPYHEYSESTLSVVRAFHLETRNTLQNAVRFSVRTNVPAEAMCGAIDECITDRRNLVFAGHSAISDPEDAGLPESGYEPVLISNLDAVLEHIRTSKGSAEVLTFEQAALKEYIKGSCMITGDSYTLDTEQLAFLKTFGIDGKRLGELI